MMGRTWALLSAAAVLLSATLLLLASEGLPGSRCGALKAWLSARRYAALYAASNSSLPAPLDARARQHLGSATQSALTQVGWRPSVKFARLDPSASVESVLGAHSYRHSGAFLLVVPGNSSLQRREEGTPFLSLGPAAANLSAVLPLSLLNAAAGALEAAVGRRLHAFRLEVAPLPACAAGAGPCAVWEGSSGRVVLDAGLAERSAGLPGLDLVLGAFTEQLGLQAAPATESLKHGTATLESLAGQFARAGAAALAMVVAAQMPAWYCIACPVVLGLLAPFLFNFGLTAVADELCGLLQLPDQECIDLWWGAFALAMVLSLGSAIPIVYLCRLPDCVRSVGRSIA